MVVPEKYREHVSSQLHEGHPRMARMKYYSKMYVWWTGIPETLSLKYVSVSSANFSSRVDQSHHCSLGRGLQVHGLDYILITLARSRVK